MAEEVRCLLRRDGFVEPDLRFVGRLVRLGREEVVEDQEPSRDIEDGDMGTRDGDGLDGKRVC